MKIFFKEIITKGLLLVVLGHLAISTFGQSNMTLFIGDKAPKLKYSKWIKGTPVDITKDNRIYVVEFWATWCGPCIAAMPHLSELAKKYADKADFIGCNVKENVGDNPYESSLPNVERFVNSSVNRMGYNVIADNNARDMEKNWVLAGGQIGIPCTFVVKNNTLMWIGHPANLDKVMEELVNGTFDTSVARKEMEQKLAVQRKEMGPYLKAIREVNRAIDNKEYDKGLRLIEKYSLKVPMAKIEMENLKFAILLKDKGETEAMNYLRRLVDGGNSKSDAIFLIRSLLDKKLSKDSYLYVANFLAGNEPKTSKNLDRTALAFSLAEDYKTAFMYQQQAVDIAKAEVKDPKYIGKVFDYTLTDYQKKADAYEKRIK